MTLDNLVGLLIVVPLQIVKYGRPYQQIGEGHDDEGQCTNLEVEKIWMILDKWNSLFGVALKFEGIQEPKFEFFCQPQISQEVGFTFKSYISPLHPLLRLF